MDMQELRREAQTMQPQLTADRRRLHRNPEAGAVLPERARCEYPAVLPHLPSLFPEHAQHAHTYQKSLALYSFLLMIYDFLYAYHPTPSEYRYIFVSAFDIYSSNFPPLL